MIASYTVSYTVTLSVLRYLVCEAIGSQNRVRV
jgi:hypothetical protein